MSEIIGIAEAWNAGFLDEEERKHDARDYLWASELGNSPIDLFLRLKGTAPSNPPNDRAKRKMGAGVDWEFTIEQILASAGILVGSQVRAEHQYEGMMKVTGKLDFLIGGKADLDASARYLSDGEKYISPNRKRAAMNTVKYYAEKYPDGFPLRPVELKSISDYAMDELEKSNTPIKRHTLQLFHYLKGLGHSAGTLSYLNRNDERMMEFAITNPGNVEDDYKKAIATISGYWYKNEQPPKEPMIFFDEDKGKFSKNLGVEYSNYLTMIYGFQEPREYSEIYAPKASNFNRICKRIKEGAKITDKNKIVMDEIEQMGFRVDNIIPKFKGGVEAEEETAS